MSGYDYHGRIASLCEKLDLDRGTAAAANAVFEEMRSIDGFTGRVSNYGGNDAAVVIAVFVAGRQRAVPLTASRAFSKAEELEELELRLQSFDSRALWRSGKKFCKDIESLGWTSLRARDFVEYYVDGVDSGVPQSEIADWTGVSQVGLRQGYKALVEELTGIDTSDMMLSESTVTSASFGFTGSGVEEFAYFLLDEVDDHFKNPKTLSAAVLYIAAELEG